MEISNIKEPSLPTLKSLEECQLGNLTITTSNASGFWAENNTLNKFVEILIPLYKEVMEISSSLSVLRAIIITNDVVKEYDRLLEGTDRKARVNPPREGMLAGKVYTWGKEETAENYYAVLVLHESTCIGTFNENDPGKALIIHELVHVAEGFETRNIIKDKNEDIYTHEIEKLNRLKAKTIVSEFIAQKIACSYYPNMLTVQEHVDFLIDIIKNTNDYLDNEITKYRFNKNIKELWAITVAELSRVFDQIGRSLGLIVSIEGEDGEKIWNLLISKIQQISEDWGEVIKEFKESLFAITTLELEQYNSLCTIIDKTYTIVGVIPECRTDGSFYVHVPFKQ